jgi:hypothetical protein
MGSFRDCARKLACFLGYKIIPAIILGAFLNNLTTDASWIFVAFFHNVSSGKGLGLYIGKKAEALRGKIKVESEVGVATEFKIYLYPNLKIGSESFK